MSVHRKIRLQSQQLKDHHAVFLQESQESGLN